MIRSSVFSDEVSTDFDETVRICAELRVGYIAPRGGLYGSDINHLQMDGALRMKKEMDRYGISVWAMGSQFGKCSLTDPADWEFHQDILERHLQFAHLWGSKVLRVFPMFLPPDLEKPETRPELEPYLPVIVERMRWACKRAEQEGILLAIEPEASTFSGTIPEISADHRRRGQPRAELLLGRGQLVALWARRPGRTTTRWSRVGSMTCTSRTALSIPNEPGQDNRQHAHRPGRDPLARHFPTLLADGYDGLASVETHLFGMPRHRWLQPATIDALRNLNRVLAEVQKKI